MLGSIPRTGKEKEKKEGREGGTERGREGDIVCHTVTPSSLSLLLDTVLSLILYFTLKGKNKNIMPSATTFTMLLVQVKTFLKAIIFYSK